MFFLTEVSEDSEKRGRVARRKRSVFIESRTRNEGNLQNGEVTSDFSRFNCLE